ncbi:MAG: phosphate/phosphite/phosphonate ABC transporter substrate-binding protein [Acidobacteria bacterium]|nr:phosphate/phosphite/phosphonate ABC transporter substrate-binding protein [Acidobacteriota bacterium]
MNPLGYLEPNGAVFAKAACNVQRRLACDAKRLPSGSRRASALFLLAAVCGLLVACRSLPQPKEKLVIAIQPTSNVDALTAESKELEAFLEGRLPDVDIEIRVPTLYSGTVEALRFGNAHAAFMSAWPAALAQKHAGAEVVLAEVREVLMGQEKVEKPFYFSYWVVRKESPFRSLDDLKGKRAAFPSPLSTSGYLIPMARLVELNKVSPADKGVDPGEFFGQVMFAGGYPQAWESLKNNQVDVIVIAGDVPEALYREVLNATRVLEEQGPIPSHAVVFSKDLQEPRRSQLKSALLDLGRGGNPALMRKFISGIFVRFEETSTEEHLATLLKSLQVTRFRFTESLP